MLRTYATPLKIDINPSKTYLIFVLVVTSMACFSISLLSTNFWFRFVLILIVSAFSIYVYIINNRPKNIIWSSQNKWEVVDKEKYSAALLPDSIVLPWLVVLNFRLETGRNKSLIVFADAIDSQSFRKLRVRLKVSAGKLFKQDK